ncbi:hypothetical protein K0M31_004908 [Melipona bicolor]|uniref:Uncharacterized protein n=1 Tax=Melipona bicolor TaxID=60889 RepID=A0AA40KMT5_9HYME|nr:hypothetical protein K0M31_004908 [Melipona bicolor]
MLPTGSNGCAGSGTRAIARALIGTNPRNDLLRKRRKEAWMHDADDQNVQLIAFDRRKPMRRKGSKRTRQRHVFGLPGTIENKHKRGKDVVLGVLKANRALIFKAYAKSAAP